MSRAEIRTLTHDDALTAAEKAREREADLAGIDAMLELEGKLSAIVNDAYELARDGWGDMREVSSLAWRALEITQTRRRIAERLTP